MIITPPFRDYSIARKHGKFLARAESGPVLYFCRRACQFLNIGAQEVYPLWALSTQSKGGLDWTTKQIGQVRDIKQFIYLFYESLPPPLYFPPLPLFPRG